MAGAVLECRQKGTPSLTSRKYRRQFLSGVLAVCPRECGYRQKISGMRTVLTNSSTHLED